MLEGDARVVLGPLQAVVLCPPGVGQPRMLAEEAMAEGLSALGQPGGVAQALAVAEDEPLERALGPQQRRERADLEPVDVDVQAALATRIIRRGGRAGSAGR